MDEQKPTYPFDISVVIPIYNEAGNIVPLHKELVHVFAQTQYSCEYIYVNDGSMDGSLDELKTLAGINIINLNRNYGQSTAFDAGFKAATGAYVVTLDGDGQNDPADIVKLLRKLETEQLDIVAGWRKHRKDSAHVRYMSCIGRFLRRWVTKDTIHDSGCTLRVYTSRAIKTLDIGGEMHRYILDLLKWKGFRIGELEVNHRQRTHGQSKYKSSKVFRGMLDLGYIWFIHKYSQRPFHFFGYLGLLLFAISLVTGTLTVFEKIYLDLSFNRNGWFFISFFSLGSGVFFLSFGLLADLLIKLHLNNSPYEKRYYIREVIVNR